MKHRLKGLAATRQVWLDDKELLPYESLRLRNHSPDGFSWGYLGSGPAQLALAVCLATMGKEKAILAYHYFKGHVIANLDIDSDFDIEIDMEKYDQ